MKVPNFKDTQVFSHLDGIGYVNKVSIDKNIHFIINFQNGSTKSFLIPLAFNSGLLSTQDRQLAGYLSSLSQDGTIKEPAKANTDIPTSSELNLTITDKYALTKQRLAMLGALDDFYQLYVDVYDFIIQQMINYSKSVFKNRNQNYAGEILFYFPDSIKPRLRKLFEPLLNKYIYTSLQMNLTVYLPAHTPLTIFLSFSHTAQNMLLLHLMIFVNLLKTFI